MNCSLPGFFVHWVFQARVPEWVAISFSRESSQPRIKPRSPTVQADALPSEPPGKRLYSNIKKKKKLILKKEKEAKLLFPQSKLLKDFLPYLLIYLTLYPLSDLMSSFSSHWALDALQTLLIFSQLWGIFHFLKCSSSSCLCSWLP